MFEAAQEYQIRNLCFWTCVNMVATAVGRCEFRTYRSNEEVFEDEHYLWNYEPNVNQNSTMFLHELVSKLFVHNEVLVIDTKRKDGKEALVIADEWEPPKRYPSKQNEYKQVKVGEVTYRKTFMEKDVLHLTLHQKNIKPVIDSLYASYYRLYETAVKAYQWGNGQHWKVHVNQLASGDEDFNARFSKMLEEQVKPFLNSNGSLLPEFDGYDYQNVGKDSAVKDTRDIKALVEDIFDFTARGFLIPVVLVNGKVEATEDANKRFLTNCIDPICDQLQEEITRKRYGYEEWQKGNFLRVDSSNIIHFDLFAMASNIEKLIGSGAFTINDIRRATNQAVINEAWANEHFMTLNISRMAQVARQLSTQKGGNA